MSLYTFKYSEALLWDTVKLLRDSLKPLGICFEDFFFFDESTANFRLSLISPYHRGKNPPTLVDSL